jgi:hypothetical protein
MKLKLFTVDWKMLFYSVVFYLLAVGSVIALTGCQNMTVSKAIGYTVNVSTIASSIKYLDDNLDRSLDKIYEGDFYSPEDKLAIQGMIDEIDRNVSMIEKAIQSKDAKEIVVTAAQMNQMVDRARGIYLEMRTIVAKYRQYYPEDVWNDVLLLNSHVTALDRSWKEVMKTSDGRDITPIVRNVLQVMGVAVNVIRVTMG